MSYRLAVLSDLPIAFWPLDEVAGTSLADISGEGHPGSQVSNPGTLDNPGLAAGMKSEIFTGVQRFTATITNIFQQGTENQAFALECWIAVTPPTEERLLMGRDSNNGLILTPGGVEFRAVNTDGTSYSAFFTVTDWDRPLHIIGNYVGYNLGIIVNNQEGTNSDFTGAFNSSSNTFMVGGSAANSNTTVELTAPAVYKKPLDIRRATNHFDHARSSYTPRDIASALGGTYYSLDDSSANIMFEFVEDTREDFSNGTVSGLYVFDDYLTALDTDGTHTTDLQYVGDLTNIAGSRIDWYSSSPVTVEISWNQGVTWTPCVNHSQVPGLAPGAALANKFFMLRKIFSDVENTPYSMMFDKLRLVVYKSKVTQANTAQTTAVYGNPTLAETATNASHRELRMGATFEPPDYLILPTEDGVRAIEFWYRRNLENGQEQYLFDTRTSDAEISPYAFITGGVATPSGNAISGIYVNGVSVGISIDHFPIGEWVHVILVFPGPLTHDLYLNSKWDGTSQGYHSFAHVNLIGQTLDARSVAVRYAMQAGLVNTTYVDSGAISVLELPSAISAYSYAWSSVQSGIV